MGGFKSNSSNWLRGEEATLKRTVRNMAGVMVNRGQMLAPVDTGALRSSGRVTGSGNKATAIFGGQSVGVPYARRREFENRKNAHTLHYMKRAGDSVVKQGIKPFYNMSK